MEGLGEGRWGAVVMLRDITRLWEMDRMKSEFVLAASHELRTPLTSIGMSIDLLMESVSPRLEARERELLAAAHEEVNRLKELVTNLLDLSKLEAGKIEMDFEAVAPASLSDRIAGIFQRQFEEKQIRFSADFPKGLPLVWADANKITWVITNIVSNASRYVPQGGHIRLSAQAVRDRVHVSVADDGPGIPLEYQSKIFEKFVQVKDVRASSGSGLGLAICKEIVKAHGGAIWVDSTPGQGSVFTFTLPVVR
jgi:NtrC-family two-component system sensor histidine kinase KinB